MKLLLVRDTMTTTYSYGALAAGTTTVQTIERPWVPAPDHLGGTNHISCVPVGTYELVLHDSEKHPQTWALVNPDLGVFHWEVPAGIGGRCLVLLHPANVAPELDGCIAPGLVRGQLNGMPAVLQSKDAFAAIKAAVPWTTGHTLTIGEYQ